MAQLQSTSISGTLSATGAVTLSNYGAGFVKLNASGAIVMDTNSYLTAESDTLASVTARGAATTGSITINGTATIATDISMTRSDTPPALVFTNQNGLRWVYSGGGNYWSTTLSIDSNSLINMGGSPLATRAWVQAQGYLTSAGSYLPLSGGTLTGTLTVNSGYNTGSPLYVYGATSGNDAVITVQRGSGSHKGSGLYISGANYTDVGNQAFIELNANTYSGSSTRYIHAYDNSGTDFVVYGDGVVTTSGSFRAPIFYDSQDTAYFGDFASRSMMYKIEVSRNGAYGSYLDADLVVGSGAADRRGYGGTGGSNIMLRSSAKSTITALDESNDLGQISYENLVWTIGENIGWGVQKVFFPGQIVAKYASSSNPDYANPLWLFASPDSDAIVIQNTTASGAAPKIYFRDSNGIIQTSNTELRLRTSNSNSLSAYLSGGDWYATGSMRAPIFYDSNDTTYYLDPNAGTSAYLAGVVQQNAGKYVRDSYYRTYSGVANYYGGGSAGWYTVASITLTSNCGGAVLYGTLYDHRYDGADTYQIAVVARSECDFTSNNESHYINVGCTILGSTNYTDYRSKIRVILSASSSGSRTYELQFYESPWNSDTWQIESNGWTVYTSPQAPSSGTGTARVNYISNQSADYQRANTAMYAPIYYDSGDTTYYVDPNSTSRLAQVNLGTANTRLISDVATGYVKIYGSASNYLAIGPYNNNGWAYQENMGNSNGTYYYVQAGRHAFDGGDLTPYADNNRNLGTGSYRWANIYAGTSVRSPIYYDSDDTGYYLNPNGTSRLNNLQLNETYSPSYTGQLILGSTSYNFNFLNGSWAGSITAGILANCSDDWEFAIHDSGHRVVSPFFFQGGGVNRILMGRDIGWGTTYIEASSSFRAPIFYDSNDTSYYLDPASTSRLRKVFIQHSSANSEAGPALRVSKGWDSGTPDYAYDTVIFEANDVVSIRMKESDGGTAGWSTGDGHTSFTSSTDQRFYVNGSTSGYIYSGMGGTLALSLDTSGNVNTSQTVYAGAFRGNGNVGGTGQATYHPAGIYSQGTNWLYGTMYLNGNTVYDADSFQLNGRYSIWGRWNTYSGYITKIAYMTFDYNSNNGNEIYHSIASTDINGSYSDAVSLNSYNDITLRLDSNNNNANSYLRISNNSAGDGTIAWIGYESGMNQNYFSGSVGISTGPRTDGYRLNMGGSIHLNGNSVDYVGSLYFNGAGHIQPNAGSYGALQMTSSKNGWSGIRFTDSEVNLMMNSNESGHYRNGYGWQFRWYNGTFYISTSGQGGGSEYIALHTGNIGSYALTETNSTFTYAASLTLSTSWQNTGVSNSNLTSNGVYVVSCSLNDFGSGGSQYSETYTGIMYWYASSTNSDNYSEISLHHMGHADNDRYIYLRTKTTPSGNGSFLQIRGNGNNSSAATYNFTFKRLL